MGCYNCEIKGKQLQLCRNCYKLLPNCFRYNINLPNEIRWFFNSVQYKKEIEDIYLIDVEYYFLNRDKLSKLSAVIEECELKITMFLLEKIKENL